MSDPLSQRLDPFTLPLSGERLIEASAGTGKTFTISLIYLRLLLGLGQQAAYPRRLSVEEILVVTFTEAASAELRARIRQKIHQLRIACVRGESDDPVMAHLLSQTADLPEAASLLLAAERQMDEAAIFTIHGFCQRMLNLNAFESGMLFSQPLIEDEQPLLRQATADFWRRHCYPLCLPVARVVAAEWKGPDELMQTLSPWLKGEAPVLKPPLSVEETLTAHHQKLLARVAQLKTEWRNSAPALPALISNSAVDKRSYSSRYLSAWLATIGQWAEEQTQDYHIPKELTRFAQTTLIEKSKKGEAPRHPLFVAIGQFLAEPLSLREWVIGRALQDIPPTIQQEKQRRAQLGFDDLLSRFDAALQQGAGTQLADAVRLRYPVALIDEYQDTDPQQYRIFRKLYFGQPESALLLIGDPKQAIYAFRGADIFTYMQARAEVKAHYSLDTNWRSSPSMIDSVNQLFSRLPAPFLFSEIPFLSVHAAPPNKTLRFTLNGEQQPALRFWLQPGSGVNVADYQQFMARQCAAEICHWLAAGQQGKALIGKTGAMRSVQASDITILVRSYAEAAVMRAALQRLKIPSVYLSTRDSVFTTPEARELLYLLQAVLAPEQETTLRTALATRILALNARELDLLCQDEQAWNQLVDEFDGYRQHWQRRGVLPMLRELMCRRGLGENLLLSEDGERRLTDLLHLAELLQEAAVQLESEYALVRWLAQQTGQPNPQAPSQQLRLESDRHLVQIVTIHKSKGLEYPLVWLPFVASYREAASGIYHDRHTFQALLDLKGNGESQKMADEERLSEDLRLLYVAMTRAVWHCSIGVAPLIKGNRKREGNTDLHKSAIGFLLQRAEPGNSERLLTLLQQLESETVALRTGEITQSHSWQPLSATDQQLSYRQVTRVLRDDWRVTSYSALQQHSPMLAQDLLPRFDVDAAGERAPSEGEEYTPHRFPRGAAPGTFLHSLFENIDFTQPLSEAWLGQQLQQQGYALQWLPLLQQWLDCILNTPLNDSGVTLSQLPPQNKQVELQFYLPVSKLLTASQLDEQIRRYDPLSAQAPILNFHQVRGMLKGFIDLVFRWQGKYYLLDYKSNWLGESAAAYTPLAMSEAMLAHRYDLQYQLYTLALHRYLRHRLAGYDYQRHFGGVVYLFLRGMDGNSKDNGIFRARPSAALVTALDGLFFGSKREARC